MKKRFTLVLGFAVSCVSVGPGLESNAQTENRIERLNNGETAISVTATELPKWTGTPAVKTFQLQESTDLRSWSGVGQEVSLEKIENAFPLRFPLPLSKSGEFRFYRLKEKLFFQFKNTTTAETPSYNAQFDGFLNQFEDMAIDEFSERYSPLGSSRRSEPVQPYLEKLSFDPTSAPFWSEFNTSPEEHNAALPANETARRQHDFRLSEKELAVYRKNGFVVSERLQRDTFVDMLYDIWSDDLPVFISSDALLQAWHRSYLAMLEETEEVFLRPGLQELLDGMAVALPAIVEEHGDGPLRPCLIDVDFFVTMARSLIRHEVQAPLFDESADVVQEMFDDAKQSAAILPKDFFGEKGRLVDFTQFRVRGHYENSVTLARYFQTMMWFGRIDLRMGGGSHSAPGSLRQLCAAATISLLLEQSGQLDRWRTIEETINAFVGFADFMTPEQMLNVLASEDLKSFEALSAPGASERLQERLLSEHHGEQEIFSSLILQGCPPTEPITLPRAFAFFGQKFVPDSWVLSRVTFDRIWRDGQPVIRRIPSGLDVVFASFGNDHVSDLVAARMKSNDGLPFRDGYPYQHSLAAARATLDSQEDGFWKTNMYQAWLGSLRSLSQESRSPRFPDALRTKAWAMKTVSTQLASWSQLRHDTVLYIKQSVTPPLGCDFPAGYVDPRLEFWERLACLAEVAHDAVNRLPVSGDQVVEAVRVDGFFEGPPNAVLNLKPGQWPASVVPLKQSDCKNRLLEHHDHFRSVADNLGGIARNQLEKEPITEEQLAFIKDMVELESVDYVGVRQYSGWYPNLYYRNAVFSGAEHPSDVWDPLVTDVHTDAPDDCHGDPGGILQEGVGNPHFLLMAVNHGEEQCVVGGPVFSHYEFMSGFDTGRLTDTQWKQKVSSGDLPPANEIAREFLVPSSPNQ
jgi:hypothetical protein